NHAFPFRGRPSPSFGFLQGRSLALAPRGFPHCDELAPSHKSSRSRLVPKRSSQSPSRDRGVPFRASPVLGEFLVHLQATLCSHPLYLDAPFDGILSDPLVFLVQP